MSNTINKQTPVTPELSDLIAVWATANGRTASTSIQLLMELLQDSLTFPGTSGIKEPNTQYSAPATTGFNIGINTSGTWDNSEDVHLILTPTAGFADGAITLPPFLELRDKQVIIVNTTQLITTFAITLNGSAGIQGAPTSMGADDFFIIKYDLTVNTWYRIG